jgi:hypothetical protein
VQSFDIFTSSVVCTNLDILRFFLLLSLSLHRQSSMSTSPDLFFPLHGSYRRNATLSFKPHHPRPSTSGSYTQSSLLLLLCFNFNWRSSPQWQSQLCSTQSTSLLVNALTDYCFSWVHPVSLCCVFCYPSSLVCHVVWCEVFVACICFYWGRGEYIGQQCCAMSCTEDKKSTKLMVFGWWNALSVFLPRIHPDAAVPLLMAHLGYHLM